MEFVPLVPAYGEQEGTLEINTDISEASAIGIEKHIDRFFGYYHYERITLRLNSPGGAVVGLEHILECIDRWRAVGRQVHTLVMFRAASATALLMALGEVGSRTAHRNSAVLFHHARVGGTQYAWTSDAAERLSSVLKIVDQGLIRQLAAHCSKGFGGDSGLAQEGAQRCLLLREHGLAIAEELRVVEQRKPLKWLPPITRMWADCKSRNSLTPYTKHLVERFEEDSGMDLREAWALGLLDRVKRVPQLDARCLPVQKPAPVESFPITRGTKQARPAMGGSSF